MISGFDILVGGLDVIALGIGADNWRKSDSVPWRLYVGGVFALNAIGAFRFFIFPIISQNVEAIYSIPISQTQAALPWLVGVLLLCSLLTAAAWWAMSSNLQPEEPKK